MKKKTFIRHFLTKTLKMFLAKIFDDFLFVEALTNSLHTNETNINLIFNKTIICFDKDEVSCLEFDAVTNGAYLFCTIYVFQLETLLDIKPCHKINYTWRAKSYVKTFKILIKGHFCVKSFCVLCININENHIIWSFSRYF